MNKKYFLIAALLFLTGCSIYNVDSNQVSPNYFPSKKSANDVVYLEKVTEDNEIIGYVTVNTERVQSQNMEDIMYKMKREAAILGADAITDIKTDATGEWKKLPAQKLIGNAYVRANFTATAIELKNKPSQ